MTDPTPNPTTVHRPFNQGSARHRHVLPPGTHALGMWLFIAALVVLFLSGMLVYIIIRITAINQNAPAPNTVTPVASEAVISAPPLHTIDMPLVLWLSTCAILISSYTIHRALDNVVHERQDRFRQALFVTLLLAVPFFLAQGAGLATLLGRASEGGAILQNAIVFLIVVHGAHLLGGLIPLAVVTKRAHSGRYDHEYHTPVRNLALYWHFLDAVWLVMFGTFLVLG